MKTETDSAWSSLSYAEKNRELYRRQVQTLDMLLVHRAISQAQYDKSFHDLTEKMKPLLGEQP